MSKNSTHYICPCEEEDMTIKDPSAVIAYCPFCGIKVETDDDLYELTEEDPLLDWDDPDRDNF